MDSGLGPSLCRGMKTGLLTLALALVLAGCAGSRYIALPPTVVPDPIRLTDPRLIQDPPAEILADFTIDAQGYIIDGPRSRPSEPVDHTRLLTNEQIAESFARVALSDSEQRAMGFARGGAKRAAEDSGVKIAKYENDIGQQILYRGGIITGETYLALERSVGMISRNTGLEIPMLPLQGPEVSLVYIFVEDQIDMQEVSDFFRERGQDFATAEDEENVYLSIADEFDLIVREDIESCLVFSGSAEDGSRISSLIVFFLNIPPLQLESCAYEETIQAMGLFNDDDSLFNTMFTDSFKEYLFPTELDWMLLRILYDDRIKNGMTRKEAMPIVRQILKETRPHGERPTAQPTAWLN